MLILFFCDWLKAESATACSVFPANAGISAQMFFILVNLTTVFPANAGKTAQRLRMTA
jgi:hypothetical protein